MLVIPPVAAGLLVAWLPLMPAVQAGIMLMAVAPVPPMVPGKELEFGGRKAYAYGLYAAMALLAVISVPLVFDVAARLFGREDRVGGAAVAATFATGVMLPLAIGILFRMVAPSLAAPPWRWVYRLSMLLIVVAFVPVIAKVWTPMTHLIGNGRGK